MPTRRDLLFGAAAASATLALDCKESLEASTTSAAAAPEAPEAVMPSDALMREHAVLQRLLIVYDECARRLETNGDPGANVVSAAARLMRTFVHDFHDAIEEEAVFPRCEQSLVHVALVRTLREQHTVARRMTDYVQQTAPTKERKRFAGALRGFARMYRAHSAREDSVLFPAFDEIVRGGERDALARSIDARARSLFGENGYERTLAEVLEIETELDLADLGRATCDFK